MDKIKKTHETIDVNITPCDEEGRQFIKVKLNASQMNKIKKII